MAGALIGAVVWCAVAMIAVVGHFRVGAIELLFLFAPLVLVQLGVAIARRVAPAPAAVGRIGEMLLPIGALFAAAAFWPAHGRGAAGLAVVWLLVAALLAVDGVAHLLRGGYRSVEGVCVFFASVFLAIGSVWFVLSRLGARPLGFAPLTVFLAAVHFHFTGFTLPIAVAATADTLRARPAVRSGATLGVVTAAIVIGLVMLAAGNGVQSPPMKLAGALLLSAASIVLAGLMLLSSPAIEPGIARALVLVSAACLVIGMSTAAVYAVGEFSHRYWLLIPQMARYHASANALGFALFGLLGWTLGARPDAA